MSKAVPLIALGIGLTIVGAYWSLYNDCLSYFDRFVIEGDFNDLFTLGWHAIPIIFLLVGIMCMIAAGVSVSKQDTWGGV